MIQREMGKKRKSIASSLDEVDRTMYASFCTAANSLSHLYTQAMNQQKLSFQAGERHGLEKVYQFIVRQQEAGSRVTSMDILTYLQNELDYCDEPSVSARAQSQHQQFYHHHHNSQPPMQPANTGLLVSSGSSGQAAPTTPGIDNQTKNSASVFSSALSSPVRRSLQHYQIAQEGGNTNPVPSPGSNARSNDAGLIQHTRDPNPGSSFDSAMDMHQD